MKKNKLIIILTSITILTILTILFFIINTQKTATINILVSPSNAKITLGDKQYKSGTYKIKPGTYNLRIDVDGFEKIDEPISVNTGEERDIYYCLKSNSDYTANFYSDHQNESNICNQIEESLLEKETNAFLNSDPIFQITPFNDYNYGFRISTTNQSITSEKIIVSIYLYTCNESRVETLKSNALEWLKSNNINPNNYNLIYSYCEN